MASLYQTQQVLDGMTRGKLTAIALEAQPSGHQHHTTFEMETAVGGY